MITRISLFSLLLLLSTATVNYTQEISSKRTYPRFAIGVTGAYAAIEPGFNVTITDTQPRSPADGKLQPGDIIISAAGHPVTAPDPRVPLGQAIGSGEGADGNLVFKIKRNGATTNVTVTIPVLGPYSRTWPLDCLKSTAIINATAEFVAQAQQTDGAFKFGKQSERDGLNGCLSSLFLLSTGDSAYLPNVELHARQLAAKVRERPTTSNWHLGYQGILLAEYFLKTGDKTVLPGLKSICDQAISAQAAGAWGHGGIPNPGYTQSGLMNSAGIPVLTTLILARECGVDVDEPGFLRSLKFFYRMAGHGCICYGDHRSELWWPNTNGRNGMVACALSLLDQPRYQKAAQHLALLVADSYYKPEFGHTGGGFNFIWRGLSSVHVPADRQSHYRRQMDHLAWYYDLSRQPDGGFSQLATPPDNKRYTGLHWGTGAIGLTYTAPLKTLRITGAPRTRYSVPTKPAPMPWGNQADLLFLSTDDAEGFATETAPPHKVYARLIGKEKDQATVEFCAKHLRHYSPLVRSWAARRLNDFNNPDAIAALEKAIKHPDPRVRRSVFDALSGYDNWGRPMRGKIPTTTVSRFLPDILKTLNNPESAWWETDGALFALGRCQPSDIRENMSQIDKFSRHPEWYLREGAFWALVGLHKTITGPEFNQLTDMYRRSRHVFARSSYDAGFRTILKSDKVALDRIWERRAASALGFTTHSPLVARGYGTGGIHEAAHRTMMILNHFDPDIFKSMIPDFLKYLDIWEPYYQHSVWLMSGSKWQPGILKVLDGLGEDGEPIRARLKEILENYDQFDRNRMSREAGELPEKIRISVRQPRRTD